MIYLQKPEIIYKSKYSIVCDLVGHPKPNSQEEEDYCQDVELKTETPKTTLSNMILNYLLRFMTKQELVHKINTITIYHDKRFVEKYFKGSYKSLMKRLGNPSE